MLLMLLLLYQNDGGGDGGVVVCRLFAGVVIYMCYDWCECVMRVLGTTKTFLVQLY